MNGGHCVELKGTEGSLNSNPKSIGFKEPMMLVAQEQPADSGVRVGLRAGARCRYDFPPEAVWVVGVVPSEVPFAGR